MSDHVARMTAEWSPGRAVNEERLAAPLHSIDCSGMEYYRGIVDQVGELLGSEAKTADDGVTGPDVLRAKVAEVAKARLECLAAAEARIARLERAGDDLAALAPTGSGAYAGWLAAKADAPAAKGTK